MDQPQKSILSFAFIGPKDSPTPTLIGLFQEDTLVATVDFADAWNLADFLYENLPPRMSVQNVS